MNADCPPPPRRNIELKARVARLAELRGVARRLATQPMFVQHQVDTYFHCPRGRLKLRTIDGTIGELIGYARSDEPQARASDYRIAQVADPAAMREVLAMALGVLVEVDKRREVYLHHNVRIHLDEVTGLGTFVELEAVLVEGVDDEAAHRQIAELSRTLGIAEADILADSYSDLLLSQY